MIFDIRVNVQPRGSRDAPGVALSCGTVCETDCKTVVVLNCSRTDSKSIMRMKSGQMFAKEDLIRGRKLLHDGALQLKNSAGRLKGS